MPSFPTCQKTNMEDHSGGFHESGLSVVLSTSVYIPLLILCPIPTPNLKKCGEVVYPRAQSRGFQIQVNSLHFIQLIQRKIVLFQHQVIVAISLQTRKSYQRLETWGFHSNGLKQLMLAWYLQKSRNESVYSIHSLTTLALCSLLGSCWTLKVICSFIIKLRTRNLMWPPDGFKNLLTINLMVVNLYVTMEYSWQTGAFQWGLVTKSV